MLQAYSDAGVYRERCGSMCIAVSLVMTENRFVKLIVSRHHKVTAPDAAELIGVCQSLKFMTEYCPNADSYVIYTDSLRVASRFLKHEIGCDVGLPARDRKIWEQAIGLCNGRNVIVRKIRAHQEAHNPNKVCDMIATKALDRVR